MKHTLRCYILIPVAVTCLSWLTGCNKDSANDIAVTGDIRLNARLLHHTWGVPYLDAYLKPNATSFPGYDTSNYEIHSKADNDGNVVFDQLHPGNYYLYAKGYDLIWGDTVVGYTPIVVAEKALTNHQLDIIVYVSE